MPPFRLVPEFAPQSGVILAWPHAFSDWRDRLQQIEPVYLDITRAISRHERVLVICYDDEHSRHVSELLQQYGVTPPAVQYVTVSTNDTWVRDYGPLSVADNGDVQLLDFTFTGWGGKYEAGLDNRAMGGLFNAGVFNIARMKKISLVLEGGSIDTDGQGTLLSTTRCLLNSGRNPGMDRHDLERRLYDRLGIDRILWLDHGNLQGDDTDGHVDMVARYCSPDVIAYIHCADPDDEHYADLNAMEQQLQGFISSAGRPYTLQPLPMPGPIYSDTGERLPASYANFLIINQAVLLPVYNDSADSQAVAAMQRCFPGREIITINCLSLIQQYGSLHCATMQLPAGVLV